MKAKIAHKIIENHFNGKITEASKKILEEIAKKAIASGINPPFALKRLAFNPDEPEIEEHSDFINHDDRHSLIPDTDEFERNSDEKVFIPSSLAIRIMDWHGGQDSPSYAVGSTAFVDKEVPVHLVEETINEFSSVLRKIRDDHQAASELSSIIRELQQSINKDKEIEDISF